MRASRWTGHLGFSDNKSDFRSLASHGFQRGGVRDSGAAASRVSSLGPVLAPSGSRGTARKKGRGLPRVAAHSTGHSAPRHCIYRVRVSQQRECRDASRGWLNPARSRAQESKLSAACAAPKGVGLARSLLATADGKAYRTERRCTGCAKALCVCGCVCV